MTNRTNTTLYTGITNNLIRRVYEHKCGLHKGFTSRYKITKLVYFESFGDVMCAILREKQIKAGSRSKKIKLFEAENPQWRDLFYENPF
jgi:putative endonuclease